MRNQKGWICYVFQILAGAILGFAAFGKFSGADGSIYVFSELGIPETRLVIALLEAVAAALLVFNYLEVIGALLGFAVMLGAFIAHMSILGMIVGEDGGRTFAMLLVVLVSTSLVMWLKREKLPLIGHTI